MSALPSEYTEICVLGEGATGRVLLARHDPTQTLVAVKHLSPALCADPAYRERFRAEAVTLHTLRHPNIVALHEYVEARGEAVLVTDLVEGVPLRALLESGAAAGPEVALTVLKGSLLGLDHAHRAGIVHRDYKPENVMVDSTGTSRLLDFGVAVAAGETTWRGGTPLYMAPEAWSVGAVTPGVDVYAATAVFFECMCGHPPFAGGGAEALRLQHLSAGIPASEVPQALRSLVRSGLAKSPAERHPSAAAFLLALEAAAEAACGAGWEQRGRRALAVASAALAVLWPLSVAAGITGGTVAGVGTATVGEGGGAGSAGGSGGAAAGGAPLGAPVAAGAAAALVLVLGGIGGGLAVTGSGPFHHGASTAPVAAAAAAAAAGTPARGTPPLSGAPPGAPATAPPAVLRAPLTPAIPTSAAPAPVPAAPQGRIPVPIPPAAPAPPPQQEPAPEVLSVSLCLHIGGRATSATACLARPISAFGDLTCSSPPAAGPPTSTCTFRLGLDIDPDHAGGVSWGFTADGRVPATRRRLPSTPV
jgi:Protein kinase domain